MKFFAVAGVLLVLSGFTFFGLAQYSKSLGKWAADKQRVVLGGKLTPCSDRPNCVCSFDNRQNYFIEPEPNFDEEKWKELIVTLNNTSGVEVLIQEEDFIYATARTKLFGFIDDMHFLWKKEDMTLHFRSASRVGYSDRGANRTRLENFRFRLRQ